MSNRRIVTVLVEVSRMLQVLRAWADFEEVERINRLAILALFRVTRGGTDRISV